MKVQKQISAADKIMAKRNDKNIKSNDGNMFSLYMSFHRNWIWKKIKFNIPYIHRNNNDEKFLIKRQKKIISIIIQTVFSFHLNSFSIWKATSCCYLIITNPMIINEWIEENECSTRESERERVNRETKKQKQNRMSLFIHS